jgi:hypothetical protein
MPSAEHHSPYFDRQGQRINLARWVELYEGYDYRRVAETTVEPYWISTVWLGIDHGWGEASPLIFETMVFAPDDTELGPEIECRRYGTEAAALAGHEETVVLVRATCVFPPDECA